jgi:transcriptional regulator with XRE-family HTH domain
VITIESSRPMPAEDSQNTPTEQEPRVQGQPEWLTSSEVAAILGITPSHLSRLKRRGEITALGRHHGVRYHRSEIDRFKEQRQSSELVTTKEAASLLNITPAYLRDLHQAGKLIPTERGRGSGRSYLYRRTDIDALSATLGYRRPVLVALRDTPASQDRVDFREALKQALERSGLTLQEAARASDLSEGTIVSWAAGHSRPFRANLERLSQVLSEPRLTELIEPSHLTSPLLITLRCRECGAVRRATGSSVRAYEAERNPARFSVDWAKREAEQICHRCTNSARLKEIQKRIVKREGRKGLQKLGRHLVKWGKDNPEERRKHMADAAAARRRGPTSLRARLSTMTLKPAGTFRLCAGCHHLLFLSTAGFLERKQRRIQNAGMFHRPCLIKWRRSPEYRHWSSAWQIAKKTGDPIPPIPLPPRGQRRPVTAEALAEGYETTLRYLWLREGLRRADRDEAGELRPISWLLSDLGLTRQGLHQRIDRFLALLPDEDNAHGLVKACREILVPLHAAAPKR